MTCLKSNTADAAASPTEHPIRVETSSARSIVQVFVPCHLSGLTLPDWKTVLHYAEQSAKSARDIRAEMNANRAAIA